MLKHREKLGISCEKCPSANICLPRGLSVDEVNLLDKLITQVLCVSKDSHIYHQNDPVKNLYAVYSGSSKEYWIDEDGNECINNFYLPGDIIGLESIPQRKYRFFAFALTDIELCVIPLDQFFELVKRSPLLLHRFIDITSYKIQNDAYLRLTTKARNRVANFLLNMLYRHEERNISVSMVPLFMTQMDISNFLGMAYETVSRILHEFQRENIVEIMSREIYIKDKEKLKLASSTVEEFGQI